MRISTLQVLRRMDEDRSSPIRFHVSPDATMPPHLTPLRHPGKLTFNIKTGRGLLKRIRVMAESQTRMLWTLAAGRASQLVRKRGTIPSAIWPPSCAPQRSLISQRSGGHENGGDAHQNKHRDDG